MDTDNSAENSADRQPRAQVDPAELHRLLGAGPDSCLVLTEGRMQIYSGPQDDVDGLVVVTQADLVVRVGERPGESELVTQAALLDSEVRSLGA